MRDQNAALPCGRLKGAPRTCDDARICDHGIYTAPWIRAARIRVSMVLGAYPTAVLGEDFGW